MKTYYTDDLYKERLDIDDAEVYLKSDVEAAVERAAIKITGHCWTEKDRNDPIGTVRQIIRKEFEA